MYQDKYPFKQKLLSGQSLFSFCLSLVTIICSTSFFTSFDCNDIFITIMVYIISFAVGELFVYIKLINLHNYLFYKNSFQELNVRENIEQSNHIKIMEIYSYGLINSNYDQLKRFLSNKKNTLEIVIFHKNSEDNYGYKYLTKKFGYEDNSIDTKIDELLSTIKKLKSEIGENCGNIKIYFSKLIPQYSMIIFDREIFCTLYKTSSGRCNEIPSLIIRKCNKDVYKFFIKDYNDVKSQGKLHEF